MGEEEEEGGMISYAAGMYRWRVDLTARKSTRWLKRGLQEGRYYGDHITTTTT